MKWVGIKLMSWAGLTIKFTFNCILIDKDGIHNVDLAQENPIAAMENAGKKAMVDTPNPPIDVGVTA